MKKTLSPALLYEILFYEYGPQGWWPSETEYEVMVGAVLAQNISWSSARRAVLNLSDALKPEALLALNSDELKARIRPAGFATRKAEYLRAVTLWYQGYGFSTERVRTGYSKTRRDELLSVRGVGRETADSILLYAFGLPEFVVDAYTRRLCARLGLKAGTDYEEIKAFFEAGLPRDVQVYNECHALIVRHGANTCKKTPDCAGCCLVQHCGWFREQGKAHRPNPAYSDDE